MATTAYIALGSNLGNRQTNLESAVKLLRQHPRVHVQKASSWWRTAPVGGPSGQPDFLNGVLEVETDLSPRELLQLLHAIEAALGRERREHHGPRVIDLDLLLFDDAVIAEPELAVPHPRLHERAFVLQPLAEVAPGIRHPTLQRTIAELLLAVGTLPREARIQQEAGTPAPAQTLKGKRAVVTGSSSGIGRAIALAFADRGASVIVHAHRSGAEAEEVLQAIRARDVRSEVILTDLRRPEGCKLLLESAWQLFGGVDVWVNNAGADILTGPNAGLGFLQKLNQLLLVDVQATMILSREVGARMKSTGQGVILNMGWDQALTGMEGDSGQLFCATKAAVMAFTKSLALSLAPEVRVNSLAPGWIRTAWGEKAPEPWQERAIRETPQRRWGTPEDVALAACWLASGDASFITGQTIAVNGGAVRL